MKTIILIIVLLIYTIAWAQLPYSFTQAAHINDGDYAFGVAVGPDGTVFLANGFDGLRAYNYDGASFTTTAHFVVGYVDLAVRLTLGFDGTIFVCYYPPPGPGGDLRAYTYNGTSFTNTAYFFRAYDPMDIAVGPDSTIFVVLLNAGLQAYTYHDTSFTMTAHINYGNSDARGVAVGSDSTIFVAFGNGGLFAYSYNDTSFSIAGHIDDGGIAYGVAIGPDGTVFLANGIDGLRAYTYNDAAFINTAHIHDGGSAQRVAIGPDGTVFLANYDDGLRAYTYNDTSFTNTAYIETHCYGPGPWNWTVDVAVDSDGTVFLANVDSGLYAYTYSGYTTIKHEQSNTPNFFSLEQNYPNPFNPSTNIEFSISKSEFVTLKVYNILGEEIASLVSEKLAAGSYSYEWDASQVASGVYLYRLKAGDYVETRKMVLMR